MYLVHVLRDIRDGSLTLATIDSLDDMPKGLQAYYQRHWRTMRSQDPARFQDYYEPVVCILASARGSAHSPSNGRSGCGRTWTARAFARSSRSGESSSTPTVLSFPRLSGDQQRQIVTPSWVWARSRFQFLR